MYRTEKPVQPVSETQVTGGPRRLELGPIRKYIGQENNRYESEGGTCG